MTNPSQYQMGQQSERLAVVETEVRTVKEELHEHKIETRQQLEIVNKKLDDLLTLKNKGAGVFWLVSAIVGSGLIGILVTIITFLKGN